MVYFFNSELYLDEHGKVRPLSDLNPKDYRVVIKGGAVSWAMEKDVHSKTKRGKGTWAYPVPSEFVRIEKSRKRSIVGFMGYVAALKEEPQDFTTLVLGKDVEDRGIDACREKFDKFRRYLERAFPDGWFLYSMEYSSQNGYHYHLLGSFGRSRVAKKPIYEKWKALTGTTYLKAAQIKPYIAELHSGYLTKKGKAANARKLKRELGRRHSWGCINKKNLPLHEEQEFSLSELQMDLFRVTLRELIIAKGGAESSIRRLKNPASFLGYCTAEMVQEALDYALSYEEVDYDC